MIKSLFKRPLFFSFFIHLSLLILLVFMPTKAPIKKESLKVHTIRLQTSKPPLKKTAAAAPKQAPAPVVKQAPAAKQAPTPVRPQVKATKKKTPVKKTQKKPTSAPAKKAPIKKRATPAAKSPKSPSKPSGKSSSAPLLALPAVFQKSLLVFFEEHLEMPEMGQVTVKLTFNKLGKIDRVEVISSESRKNELYLLKALKHLNIPYPQKGAFEPIVVEFGNALKNS